MVAILLIGWERRILSNMTFKTPSPLIDKISNENVFDGDYRRSWGDSEAIKKIHEFLRSDPTKADAKFIKAQFPEADDELINNALDQVEVIDSFAGVPKTPEYYYRGVRYAPNEEEENKIKQDIHNKLPF